MIKLRENVFHQTQNQRLLSDINSFYLQVEDITDEHIGERRAFPTPTNTLKWIEKKLRIAVYANGCSHCMKKRMME